ncbi:peroxin [Marasmius tenuissimus]|uniref:Peroxin n=1 Tax=Marasmius tenuissimus TaxID=585030 RepID=A0ABR2ZG26_9AGAR
MLSTVKKAINDRRSTLTTAAGVGVGIYFVRTYVKSRLEEVKERLEDERLAKDVLKRRFEQSKEDVEYTVMALLPELAEGILAELNVEEVTRELQNLRAGGEGRGIEGSPLQRPPSSLASSMDSEMRSDTGLSTSGLQGWVEAGQTAGTYSSEGSHLSNSFVTSYSGSEPSTSSSASVVGDVSDREQDHQRQHPPPMTDLTSSITSITSSSSVNSHASSSSSSRSKAQLWNNLKTLTFTRTLTTIYAVSLLTLFTSIQLTILAREKYLRGVYQMERDERMREEMEASFRREMSFTGMAFSLLKSKLGFATEETDLFDSLSHQMTPTELVDPADIPSITNMSDAAFDSLSTKYLTLSYHLLHIGFRDLSARVQAAVEDVLQPVSLKTRLSLTDVHRLVQDIRRKVEWEITFEGRERKVTFEHSCVPQTRELVERTLRLGGWAEADTQFELSLENDDLLSSPLLSSEVESSQLSYDLESRVIAPNLVRLLPPNLRPLNPSTSNTIEDTQFTHLIDETRTLLMSSDFTYVLDVCLDHTVGLLMDSLEQGVLLKNDSGEETPRIRMASLLPPLAHWSKQTLVGLPSEAVDGLIGSSGSGGLREVSALIAIVFGKFEDNR